VVGMGEAGHLDPWLYGRVEMVTWKGRVYLGLVRQGEKAEYIPTHVRGMGVSAQYGQHTGMIQYWWEIY